MYPELPKIELFARQARPGWSMGQRSSMDPGEMPDIRPSCGGGLLRTFQGPPMPPVWMHTSCLVKPRAASWSVQILSAAVPCWYRRRKEGPKAK
jgi:hypothetical protein